MPNLARTFFLKKLKNKNLAKNPEKIQTSKNPQKIFIFLHNPTLEKIHSKIYNFSDRFWQIYSLNIGSSVPFGTIINSSRTNTRFSISHALKLFVHNV